MGVGINESWPRTITRHEGRKSVTGSDKLPLDLWRQPLELSGTLLPMANSGGDGDDVGVGDGAVC